MKNKFKYKNNTIDSNVYSLIRRKEFYLNILL